MRKYIFTKHLPAKIILLLAVVFFSQCSSFRFTERKYTKGRYRDHAESVSVKKKPSRPIEMPDVDAKTDVSVETKAPVEQQPEAEAPVASTDKHAPAEVTAKAPASSLPQPAYKKPAVKLSKKALAAASKMPFSAVLLKAQAKKQAAATGDKSLATTILSITAFACGVVAVIFSIVAIIDSFVIAAVSPVFFVALGLGVVAVVCGILTLILGHGDLEGFEKTFAILGISLGGAAIIITLIWTLVTAAIFAD